MDIATILIAVLFQTIFQVNSYACIPQVDKDLMVQNIITAINSAKSDTPISQTPVAPETPVLGSTSVSPVISEACKGATDNYKDMVAVVQNNRDGLAEDIKLANRQSVGDEAKARYRAQAEAEWNPRIANWEKRANDRKVIMDNACN